MNTQTNSIYYNSELPLSPILGPCDAKGSPGYSPFGCSFLMSIFHTNPESHQAQYNPKDPKFIHIPQIYIKYINRLKILEKPLTVPSQNLSQEHRWFVRISKTQRLLFNLPNSGREQTTGSPFLPHFRDPVAHWHLLMMWI